MSVVRVLRQVAVLAFSALLASTQVIAASVQSQQASIDALTHAVEAVVGVQVHAAEGARSADTLGRERSGSGVLIDADGLILTIGYLIVEADSIQVTTSDHRVLPARAVGYDLATGFGLVRTLLPLRGIRPLALGSARDTLPRTPLMAAAGGDGGGPIVTQLLSVRPFSGYWEYHIDNALFTSPPLTLEGFYKKLWDRPQAEGEVLLTVLQGADIRQVKVKTVDRMKTMRKPEGI